MKSSLIILFLFCAVAVNAQKEEGKLISTMKEFHQALVNKDYEAIRKYTDDALSYGHSNGWIETKEEVVTDIEKGILTYQGIKEDSINITINGPAAHIRFIADIDATLRGNINKFHLKVLEVWVKKDEKWLLFARQAIR